MIKGTKIMGSPRIINTNNDQWPKNVVVVVCNVVVYSQTHELYYQYFHVKFLLTFASDFHKNLSP